MQIHGLNIFNCPNNNQKKTTKRERKKNHWNIQLKRQEGNWNRGTYNIWDEFFGGTVTVELQPAIDTIVAASHNNAFQRTPRRDPTRRDLYFSIFHFYFYFQPTEWPLTLFKQNEPDEMHRAEM